jgi:DNA-binding transcriptional LysR family regulator
LAVDLVSIGIWPECLGEKHQPSLRHAGSYEKKEEDNIRACSSVWSIGVFEWDDLRIFLVIAREGTLGGAARKLSQTQPTMGRRLRALEVAVGHTLFQRTANGLVLTDEGAATLVHAERIEQEALAFERRLSASDTQLEGVLRVTCSEWFGTYILSSVIAAFSEYHPAVCTEVLTDSRLYSLARRDADLAFRITPFRDPEVISRSLVRIKYGLYGTRGTPCPKIGDGRGVRLVTMDSGFADMPDAVWLRRVFPNAVTAARSNNREVQAQLCARGTGLTVLPQPLGDATPGIALLDIAEEPPDRTTYLGYHRDLRRLPRLRALVDFVIERLAN